MMVATPQSAGTTTPPLLQDAFARAGDGHEYNPELIARQVEERRAQIIHNLGQSEDGTQSVGLIADGSGAIRRDLEDQRRADEKERRERIDRILLAQINARIAEIDARLEILYDRRDDLADEMQGLREQIGVLESAIGRLQAGEEPERNEDGSLANERLEAELRAYERRTGRQIDRNDPDALLAALLAQQDYREHQLDDAERRNRDNEAEIGGLESERGELVAQKDHVRREQFNQQEAPAAEVASADSQINRAAGFGAARGTQNDLNDLEPDDIPEQFADLGAGLFGDDDSFASEVDEAQGTGTPGTNPVSADDAGANRPDADRSPVNDGASGPATPGAGAGP